MFIISYFLITLVIFDNYKYLDRDFSFLFLVKQNPYKSYSQKVVENVTHTILFRFQFFLLNYVKVEYVFSSANELKLLLLKSINYVWACLCYI